MQVPVEIDFQGVEPDAPLRAGIERRIGELETRFGRVTSCRVVLKGPGGRHKTGGLYEVNIQLVLPGGRTVNVGRTPSVDERHSNIDFAINDAFKRTRRRLQDKARRLQGQVKASEGPPIGTVIRLQDDYGFLESADGREIYFHRNSVLNNTFDRLTTGTRVAFAEVAGEKGPQASTVRILGKHGLRA